MKAMHRAFIKDQQDMLRDEREAQARERELAAARELKERELAAARELKERELVEAKTAHEREIQRMQLQQEDHDGPISLT